MKTKKTLLFLIVGLLMLYVLNAFTEDTIGLMYEHIDLINADLSIANGTATCTGMLQPTSSEHTGYLSVSLQQKNGIKWKTISSWRKKGSAGDIVLLTKNSNVSKGFTYRVHIYAVIYDKSGNIIESANTNSNSVAY